MLGGVYECAVCVCVRVYVCVASRVLWASYDRETQVEAITESFQLFIQGVLRACRVLRRGQHDSESSLKVLVLVELTLWADVGGTNKKIQITSGGVQCIKTQSSLMKGRGETVGLLWGGSGEARVGGGLGDGAQRAALSGAACPTGRQRETQPWSPSKAFCYSRCY